MAWEYWLIFGLILIGVFAQYNSEKFKGRYYYTFLCILLVLMAGFRYKLGPDWPAYYALHEILVYANFNDLIDIGRSFSFEMGYVYYEYIFAQIYKEVWFFQLGLVGLAIYVKARFTYKYLDFHFLGLAFYFMPLFFFSELIQIRQGFSGAVLFLSVHYILKKKLIPFLICIVVAMQFHTSSIVFILAYWVGNNKINFKVMVIGFLVVFILSPLGLSRPMASVLELLPISSVQETYLDYRTQEEATGAINFELNEVVRLLFFLAIIIYNGIAEKKLGQTYLVFRNLFIFSLYLFYFFRTEPIFAIRLPGAYAAFMGFVVPQIVYVMKEKKLDYSILYGMVIIYLVLLAFRFQTLNNYFFNYYPNYIYYKYNPQD